MKGPSRSLSNDRLEGESDADINYESITKVKRVAAVHPPLQN